MNYGLWLSAGGALANMHRQDVLANNLANVNTVGFKPDITLLNQRLPERLEGPGTTADPKYLLEQLGGGTLARPSYVSRTQGPLTRTERPFDLALRGDGFFLVEEGPAGSPAGWRLTRDGRFDRDDSGYLVMQGTGARVLDAEHMPIQLGRTGAVHIDGTGLVTQSGRRVAQLRVVDPGDVPLTKAGDNLYRLETVPEPGTKSGSAQVEQGYVEESAVNPVRTLSRLISASKSAQSNARMMQYHDQIIGQAVNTFGRVV
mgnify:CR=1 FL=1